MVGGAGGRGRRGVLPRVLAAALAAEGASVVGWVLATQVHAPQPRAAAAGRIVPYQAFNGYRSPPAEVSAGSTGPAPTGPVLPRSEPTTVAIPAIGVRSRLQYLGIGPDGRIQVPQPGPRYNQAAWYDRSPTPGQLGPAVIEGHVDSAAQGPSVFFRLGAMAPGDRVMVGRADGTTAVFTVDAVRRYPKTAFPTAAVYGNTNYAALRLLTCGGAFDHASGHYLDNIVVFAHLTGTRPGGP